LRRGSLFGQNVRIGKWSNSDLSKGFIIPFLAHDLQSVLFRYLIFQGKQKLIIRGLIWYGDMRYEVLNLSFESWDQFEIPE